MQYKPYDLGVFEIHAVDHCNMFCKNCCKFSPYFTVKHGKKEYEAVDYFPWIDEMIRRNISFRRIIVLGGEPFLHSNLMEFVRELKQRYRKEIEILTNGTWMMSQIRELEVFQYVDVLSFSKYPAVVAKMPDFDDRAMAIGRIYPNCRIEFRGIFDKFVDTGFSTEKFVPDRFCPSSDCTVLEADGRIWRCAMVCRAEDSPSANKEVLEARENDSYNLRRDDGCDFGEWKKRYPFNTCNYCKSWRRDDLIPWESNVKEIRAIIGESAVKMQNKDVVEYWGDVVCDVPPEMSLSGIWFEGLGLVRIEEDGPKIKASCRYWYRDKGEISWTFEGNKCASGIEGSLVHQKGWIGDKQHRVGNVLSEKLIHGTATISGTMIPFTWKRLSVEEVCEAVPGHLTPVEIVALRNYATRIGELGGHILEIGAMFGKSACAMAYGLVEKDISSKIFSVDSWHGVRVKEYIKTWPPHAKLSVRDDLLKESLLTAFLEYTSPFTGYIIPVVGHSHDSVPVVAQGAKIVFIDGDHSSESVKSDVLDILNAKSVELLILHDWTFPTVREGAQSAGLVNPDELIGENLAVWEFRR